MKKILAIMCLMGIDEDFDVIISSRLPHKTLCVTN